MAELDDKELSTRIQDLRKQIVRCRVQEAHLQFELDQANRERSLRDSIKLQGDGGSTRAAGAAASSGGQFIEQGADEKFKEERAAMRARSVSRGNKRRDDSS